MPGLAVASSDYWQPFHRKTNLPMNTKVIFLDCDGVVCTRRSFLANDPEGTIWFSWDEVACAAIRRACEQGVKIVISSTWRKEMHRDQLFQQLEKYGLKEYLHEDWMTPITDTPLSGVQRGLEIEQWLADHPETESYRILDDVPEFSKEQDRYFIHTDSEEGMSSDDIKRLLNWAKALKA